MVPSFIRSCRTVVTHLVYFFFFNDTATTEIYTLSLHDALPILVGGLAYELPGLIASYPSPGHDGKLFASTMLPLILLALVLALRDRRWQGYPLLAAATGLTLLGHFQLAYYSLIVAGLFALYLTLE